MLLQKRQSSALGPKSMPGMFVGYELGSNAYRMSTGRTFKISRDVELMEHINGAAAVGYQDLVTWGAGVLPTKDAVAASYAA